MFRMIDGCLGHIFAIFGFITLFFLLKSCLIS